MVCYGLGRPPPAQDNLGAALNHGPSSAFAPPRPRGRMLAAHARPARADPQGPPPEALNIAAQLRRLAQIAHILGVRVATLPGFPPSAAQKVRFWPSRCPKSVEVIPSYKS